MKGASPLLPPDLPSRCGKCEAPLTLFQNYGTRYGPLARRLLSLGWLGGPVGLVLWLMLSAEFGGGRSVGFGIAICMILPVTISEGVVLLFCRKVRRLHCHRCGWEKEFPWPDCAVRSSGNKKSEN